MKYIHSSGNAFKHPVFPVLFMLLMVLAAVPSLQAQHVIVQGVITDNASGDPIPGVNIVIQGTSQGTATNLDGEYELEVPGSDTAVLVFSDRKSVVEGRSGHID